MTVRTAMTAIAALLLTVQPTGAAAQPASSAAEAVPRVFETRHSGRFGGERIAYRALVEEHFLELEGRRAASVFTTSYIRTDVPAGTERPVVFVFNGGPGSASLWLHMGYVGPRRVAFGDDVRPETAPPFRIADNPDSPLDVADIVLIDPPGTGFSRVLSPEDERHFYGTQQDARATVEVIAAWVRRHGRWNAPRYLMGESYGAVRAAVVARLLAGGPFGTGGMNALPLSGVILLGQAMDSGEGEDVGALTALTAIAATAWYHGRVDRGRSLDDHVAEAASFVEDDLVRAYFQGARLPEPEQARIAATLSRLTGLPADEIVSLRLRVPPRAFAQRLLAADGLALGMYDSRYTLPLAASGNDPVADDPAMGQYVPGYVAALNAHMRGTLGADLPIDYEPIAFRAVNARWDWGQGPGIVGPRRHSADLAIAMRRNPELRLMVGTGHYDLVTTPGMADYTLAQAGIPAERTIVRLYESGHMPYMGPEARAALARDVRGFVAAGRGAR